MGSFGESEGPYQLTFIQPYVRVVSMNEVKRHAFARSKASLGVHRELAGWRQAAHSAWKRERTGRVGAVLGQPAIVCVSLGFHDNRRRDPHNYVGTVVKSIIDGLVIADVWPDDNPEWVVVLEPKLVVHSRTPKDQRLPCTVEFTLRGGD